MKNNTQNRQQMNIVIVGHVDHGKSTIIGRLLADTHSLPDGKLEQVRRTCEMNSKPFEYAFLLDALKDEQDQGITIDAARVFFSTATRDYIIIDAPGHIEFLKNMITGASRAESALLVIDAKEGVQENSRRHGYMISMLGISQLTVLVNKMDLVDYDQSTFDKIVSEYSEFLNDIGVTPRGFIPVSGFKGDLVASISDNMPWYTGRTVLEELDYFTKENAPVKLPFRMPVQAIYKFTQNGDDRRIVAGTITTGTVKTGDRIIFYPSGKTSTVKSIESFNAPHSDVAAAGMATGFTLNEQIYINRGDIAALAGETQPEVTTRIRVSLFWIGRDPLKKGREYVLKVGSDRVAVKLEEILRVVDASNLNVSEEKSDVQRHDVAECILKLNKPIAFDTADKLALTSRFVIIDNYEIRGGGIIREAQADKQSQIRDKVLLRNYKWEQSVIPAEKRAEKYNQKSSLILITGRSNSGRRIIAKRLEEILFDEGKIVYYLAIGSVIYGVDADITANGNSREEHMRRLAEISHILLDAGVILIITAVELLQADLELIKTAIDPDQIETVWVGDDISSDISFDLQLQADQPLVNSISAIKSLLQEKGIIFRPW
ncbi:MAG: adenylyl-sulfate kinase [Candidatus Marinimicrobia bacterium]|nr:adenylyl-sulfate kinase [Candidatus Neomarinimicrobiota bacterium]